MYEMYEKPEPSSTKPGFTWDCPEPGCKKYIAAWTQKGLDYLKEEHASKHRMEQKAASTLVGSMALLRKRDPNKLNVTLVDIGFLKTRQIKIDDDIVLDFGVEEKPSKTELSQRRWAEILERAWSQSSTYGVKRANIAICRPN